jgi:hypothetical protein
MNDRKAIAIRQTLAVGLALLAALFAFGLCHCHALTPAEQATVASDGVKLSMCATQAHICKVERHILDDAGPGEYGPCWDEYVACKVAHGFDGGAK